IQASASATSEQIDFLVSYDYGTSSSEAPIYFHRKGDARFSMLAALRVLRSTLRAAVGVTAAIGLIVSQLAPAAQAAPFARPSADLAPGPRNGDDNPPPESQAEPAAGGDTSEVAASGAFTYARHVTVPVARGPVPSISVAYSSNAPNGIAGVGWRLTGL